MVECRCGCGQKIIQRYNSRTKKMTEFIHGHNAINRIVSKETREKMRLKMTGKYDGNRHPMYGKTRSNETIEKLRIINTNERNPAWRGDDVGYNALHGWVRRHLPKPQRCQKCNIINHKLDLACVTNVYNRDFSNWMYMCRSCHQKTHGKIAYRPISSNSNRVVLSTSERIRLHRKIRKMLPKPDLCSMCESTNPTDVHNISETYSSNLSDWMWVCERCHNRHHKLIDMSDRECSRCESKTTKPKASGRPNWRYINGELVCLRCYTKYNNNERNRERLRNG